MNPKEKAEELFQKFIRFTPADEELEFEYTKQCAIIAVDEIIRLANRPDLFKMRTKSQHVNNSPVDETYVEYWVEVKKEIEKL